jgi:hypothetical protein
MPAPDVHRRPPERGRSVTPREPNSRVHVLDGHIAWVGGTTIMPPERDNPSRWWVLAAEARAVAAEMTDPLARRTMLKIAEGYERLARRAEDRNKGSN